jgi:HTH-type transcriptional regulator/antitoxin HipB
MIKNERQYKITRSKADEVRVAISELERAPLPEGLSAEMRELQMQALRGLTQRELADRLGIAEQSIQRYEAGDYAGVSFARLVEIAEALAVTVHYDVRLASAS